ncbi:GntR family transcriptional regulator [Paucibacter sp. Y2R2-4]|uniref:GntR family transcriptional regulator n=1 Tax=Paucibacter sp. Y2R2-4 TaxID=2893553 RepID=UPI0021E38086|nr:GntR family transcriptional regulator [Paucibacter sp. Y2R2-4]MCV2352297.1 GntR family transcriptional regulator [Paucibacter sp. Y2R2-4]
MDTFAHQGGPDLGLTKAYLKDEGRGSGPAWRRARQPLYMNLAQQLREGLRQGHWPASHALPSERELADLLLVSRETARKAMDLLCERGWLQRVQGSGTFATVLQQPFSALPVAAVLAAVPEPALLPAPSIQQLGRRRRLADAQERRLFGLAAEAEVWQALCMDCSPAGAPELRSRIQPVDTAGEVWPQVLAETLQGQAQPPRLIRIEALAANAQQAHYLGLRSGEAVLRLSHVQTSADGRVLALLHSDCKGAEACFSVETPIPS